MAATIGSLFHQGGKIWANGYEIPSIEAVILFTNWKRVKRAACFHYDPECGRYGVVVMNLVRLGGVITLLFMGGFILMTRRRESRPPTPSPV